MSDANRMKVENGVWSQGRTDKCMNRVEKGRECVQSKKGAVNDVP